jgi:hypothetical protein
MALGRFRDIVKSDNAKVDAWCFPMLVQCLDGAKRYDIVKAKGRGRRFG